MYRMLGILVCSIVVLSVQFPAQAGLKSWSNASGGTWFSPGSWTPAGVPGAGDTASITLAGTYTVTIDSHNVTIALLDLGGSSGVQTLEVIPHADSLILALDGSVSVGQINANGRLSVGRAVLAIGAWNSFTSGGAVTVDSLGNITLGSYATFTNDTGGTVTFSGNSGIYGYDPKMGQYVWVNNNGVFTKTGGDTLALSCQYSQSLTGSFTLQSGVMQIWEFTTNGPVTLASGTTTLVSLGGEYYTHLTIYSSGIVDLQGTANVAGSNGYINNQGLLKHTLVGASTVACNHFGPTSGPQKLQVVAGKLSLTGMYNEMIDSVEIGPTAEFEANNTNFNYGSHVVSSVPDSGSLTLTGSSTTAFHGAFTFSGNLDVNSYYVDFSPTTDPVWLHTFTIEPGAQFVSTVTVNSDIVNMNGGSTNSNVTVGNQYNWMAGTFMGNSGDSVSIDYGINLTVVGPQPKLLDTRNMIISGTANMSGSGALALSGGASITVSPTGSLAIGDSIAITGVGDSIINHGQMTFTCPLDTAVIGAFLYNKPLARTPGTIDILSGTVTCGSSTNCGTVNVRGGSQMIVGGTVARNSSGRISLDGGAEIPRSGTLENAGDIFIDTGAVLRILGTFVNQPTGVIRGGGMLDVSGATFTNYGSINPGASPGELTIFGHLNTQGTINIEVAGRNQGAEYDLLRVLGTTQLGGTLQLFRRNGFIPSMTDTFRFMLYNAHSDGFGSVLGTAIGNGKYMEIAYRPTEIVQYVCDGISDITVTPGSIVDTVRTGRRDTLTLQICNDGHCPLEWTSDFIQTTPPNPPASKWLTIISGGTGLLTRQQCMTMQFEFNTAGLAPGAYTGQISIPSNDPDEPVTYIPVQFVCAELPDTCVFHSEVVDMGDLPACNYPTLVNNPGHMLTGIAWLGACVTGEQAPNIPNLDPCDDGVVFRNLPWMPCSVVSVTVTVHSGPNFDRYHNCGEHLYLNAWKDGNLDGDFCDDLACVSTSASEWIIQDQLVTPGVRTFSFIDPGVFNLGQYMGVFRFRLTSQPVGRFGFGLLDPNACPNMGCGTFGLDYLGEVEDYVISDAQLSVELQSFEAVPGDGAVTLRWITASETRNDHFEIVRDGVTIARVVTQGNGATGHTYTITDNGLTNGTTYTYELFAIDVNDDRQSLQTLSATPSRGAAEVTEYALCQNYPNPFNPGTEIGFDLVERGLVSLKVYNLLGQEVATLLNRELAAGHHTTNFTADNLPSGVYLYRMTVNGFVAEKKMLLMK